MLPNEVFALKCRKRYEEQGLIVNKSNGQFAHCPLPRGMGEEGVYLLWGDHQHQGLLQSRDVGRKCYFNGDVKLWFDTFPEGFFELYEIYDEFNSGKHHSMYGRTGKRHPLFGVPKTEEAKKKMSEARKGKYAGENNPMYGVHRTEEEKKKISVAMSGENHPQYGKTGALHHNSKAIITIQPDGTELHFGSGREAVRELGIPQRQLLGYLKTGQVPKWGKFGGWQFLYA